jgi:hypothetical protein
VSRSRRPGRRGLDGESAFLCEGEERFGGFLRYEGQVDVFPGERPLVGAAEQEQCFGEVDRSGVDGMEVVDEFAVGALGVVAGDVEECLRDRQRGAQFVRGVGCESLLFGCESLLLGHVRFEPREHGVEAVGELAKLVLTSFQLDSVGERSGRGYACGVCDAGQGASMRPARNQPPRRPNTSRNANTAAALGAKTCRRLDRMGKTPGVGVGLTRSARSGT